MPHVHDQSGSRPWPWSWSVRTQGRSGVVPKTANPFRVQVCREFGASGRVAICGHAVIETGLAELGRALDEPRYIEQAKLFVDRHGMGTLRDIEWGRSYFQDDVPVREAEVLRGHAVRANYLAAGSVDVAVESNDAALLDALRRQWQNTVARRTYITGGQGSHHQDEAFGLDWELPPDRAYSETCAGVGSIMFAWRMLLADADPRYSDLIERTLYNVVATSPSDDGRAFYYANTLHQRVPGTEVDPDSTSPRAGSALRAPWFDVSCCPPNVARTLASLDAYIATADEDGVQLQQFAAASVATILPDGRAVSFDVETRYPEDGVIRVLIREDGEWTLGLRVPAWAAHADLRIEGADGSAEQRDVASGIAEVRRAFRVGDAVTLRLPMAPRVAYPDSRIDAVRGSVAIERGPEVLALESVDFGDDVANAALEPGVTPTERDGRVWVRVARRDDDAVTWPYTPSGETGWSEPVEVALVPYHEWARRGPSTMRVWIPTA